MTQNEKKPKKQEFGIQGFGVDPTWQTTRFTVCAIVNYALLLAVFSALLHKPLDIQEFYIYCSTLIFSCFASLFVIRFDDLSTTFAAWLLAAIAPDFVGAHILYLNLTSAG